MSKMVVRSLVSAHCVVAAVSLSLQWGPVGAQHAPHASHARFSSSPLQGVSHGGETVSLEVGTTPLSSEPPLGSWQTDGSGIDTMELKLDLERELDLERGGLEGRSSLESNHNDSLATPITPMNSPPLNGSVRDQIHVHHELRSDVTRLDQVQYGSVTTTDRSIACFDHCF